MMTRYIFHLCCGLMLLMCSCTHISQSNGVLRLSPGVGIIGVAEVGMNLKELRNLNKDIVIEKRKDEDEYSAKIPSLGMTFGGHTAKQEVEVLSFHTDDSNKAEVRFTGTVLGLEFKPTGNVTYSDVTNMFGEPTRFITLDPDGSFQSNRGSARELIDSVANGYFTELKLLSKTAEGKILYYHGISFQLRDNVVHTIVITKKKFEQIK